MALLVGLGSSVQGAQAQAGGEPNDFRIGVTLGGTALIGLSLEHIWDQTAVELNIGTWAFKDISVSLAGKQYLGEGRIRGFLGLGLWSVTASQEEGIGSGLILEAPIGFEVEIFRRTAFGAALNVSRALWIKRADPEDETPPSNRIIPLPGFYAKWAQRR